MGWKTQKMEKTEQEKPSQKSKSESEDGTIDIKKKTFVGLISRFAGKTSMQGIPYINAARLWYAKAVWTFLTVAALAVSIVHMYYLIDLYMLYDTKTQISLNFSTLTMPAVTLCNTNPVRKSQVTDENTNEEFVDYIDKISPAKLVAPEYATNRRDRKKRKKRFASSVKNFNRTGFFNPDKYRDEEEIAEDEELGELDGATALLSEFKYLYTGLRREVRFKIGHHMRDMLTSCSFKGRTCGAGKFVHSQSNDYGNCFTIQSPGYNVEKSGPGGGFTMVLFLENHENIAGINNGYGLRVVIHEQNTTEFPTEEGFFVSANTETNIGLRMVNIIRMSDPYGTCVDASSYESRFGIVYTRQACQSFCLQQRIIDVCKCFSELYDDVVIKMNKTGYIGSDLSNCKTDSQMKCMYGLEDKYTSGEMNCSCDSPCEENDYAVSLSSRQWPVDSYARLLIQSVCENENSTSTACRELEKNKGNPRELTQNFVKLNIYFEDLNYEKIEEIQDYEDIQFVSDVGGAIGLWIGLSMLSVLELGQLLVELLEFAAYKCCGVNCTASKSKDGDKSNKGEKNDRYSEPPSNRGEANDRYSDPHSSSRYSEEPRHGVPRYYENKFELDEGVSRNGYDVNRADFHRQYPHGY